MPETGSVAPSRPARRTRTERSEPMAVVSFQDLPLADADHAWHRGGRAAGALLGAPRRRRQRAAPRGPRVIRRGEGRQLHRLQAADCGYGGRRADRGPTSGHPHAGGNVDGARGGPEIPTADVDGVKQHLSRYYAKMGEEPPCVPAWAALWRGGTRRAPSRDRRHHGVRRSRAGGEIHTPDVGGREKPHLASNGRCRCE